MYRNVRNRMRELFSKAGDDLMNSRSQLPAEKENNDSSRTIRYLPNAHPMS